MLLQMLVEKLNVGTFVCSNRMDTLSRSVGGCKLRLQKNYLVVLDVLYLCASKTVSSVRLVMSSGSQSANILLGLTRTLTGSSGCSCCYES